MGGYVSPRDHDPPRPARRDRLEPRAALAGPRRPAAERHRPRAGARARGAARRRADRRDLLPVTWRARETAEIVAPRSGSASRRPGAARGERRRLVGPDRRTRSASELDGRGRDGRERIAKRSARGASERIASGTRAGVSSSSPTAARWRVLRRPRRRFASPVIDELRRLGRGRRGRPASLARLTARGGLHQQVQG